MQDDVNPLVSVYMYATGVVPTAKLVPGSWVRTVVKDVWSVALGSVQVTVVSVVPSSVATSMLAGHPVTTGGPLSADKT